MPNQLTLTFNPMKKLIIIFSLFLISCGTKTETQVKAEKIQQEAKEQMNALPVPVVDSANVDWGAPESTCHN